MRLNRILTVVGLAAAMSATANAQFSASGPGSPIPASGTGGGGIWPLTLPGTPAASAAAVGVAVTHIDSVVIDNLTHSWVGDTQATLVDPMGVEHLLYLRPGFAGSGFGSSGDFTGGTYTFVESGGSALPTSGNIDAGTYDQSFDSGGGAVWNSGDAGIINTPLSMISGPAGDWVLTVYDWAGGDPGNFDGWTLNGNSPPPANVGSAFCFGDGTGAACPCTNGGAGEGCANSTGAGGVLTGGGNATFPNDTFDLTGTNLPLVTLGLVLRGDGQVAIPAGEGILCVAGPGSSMRSQVEFTGNGTMAFTNFNGLGFASVANIGISTYFQLWYRDPANTCGTSGFNFTNGWDVIYTL